MRRKFEDEVARLFETLRAKHELPPLTRIIHRQALEELVCSSAALDMAVWEENSPGAVMYKTNDPATTHTELERIGARNSEASRGSSNWQHLQNRQSFPAQRYQVPAQRYQAPPQHFQSAPRSAPRFGGGGFGSFGGGGGFHGSGGGFHGGGGHGGRR